MESTISSVLYHLDLWEITRPDHNNERSISCQQAEKFDMCDENFQRSDPEKFGIHSNP